MLASTTYSESTRRPRTTYLSHTSAVEIKSPTDNYWLCSSKNQQLLSPFSLLSFKQFGVWMFSGIFPPCTRDFYILIQAETAEVLGLRRADKLILHKLFELSCAALVHLRRKRLRI